MSTIKDMMSNFQKLEKFEGVDFRRWQKKMHFLLTSLGVAYVLSTPKPEEHEDETLEATRKRNKWENDDYICRGHILNGMSNLLFDVYQFSESSKSLWDDLEAKYMAEDASSSKFLVSRFNNFKIVDGRSVMEQFHELQSMLGSFRQHNINIDETFIVSSIIDKLPNSWKDFRNELKHKKEKISLDDLGSHIRIEEGIRINDGQKDVNPSSSTVNMVEDGKTNEKKRGNNTSNQNKGKKPKVSSDGKKSRGCWCCGKPGHLKKDCTIWKKKMSKKNAQVGKGDQSQPQDKQGNYCTQISHSSFENYVCMISEINGVQVDCAWYIDSGASRHVCRDRSLFKTFMEVDNGETLFMGNDSMAKVLGKGQVELVFSSGKSLILRDVLYSPELRRNLVSGVILNRLGFKMVYESDKFVLSKGSLFVGFGYLCDSMFKLSLCNTMNSSVYVVNYISSLWHLRLGHVNYKKLHFMSKHGLIPDFDPRIEKCKTCMLTKITRMPFPKNVDKNNSLLDLVHSDLCDFHSTPSLGNKKYLVTFIDDYSRFCYVYLLFSKDEALDKFRIYKEEVELQTNNKIKRLRTDKGGEYYNPSYFQSLGLVHETTAAYTPQQNGVAERKNRTLEEMVNSMLSYSGLSDGFWGEAVLTACYVLNRVPMNRNESTPYEVWYKRKPNLSHLKVWGCRAIVKVPEPKRKKLGERGVECIFIGYAEHSKSYRFYVIEQNDFWSVHTTIESRDALFDEYRFSSIPRPRDVTPNTIAQSSLDQVEIDQEVDDQTHLEEASTSSQPRRSKRARKEKSFGPDFYVYLVEGSRESVTTQLSYIFNVDDDPLTYDEAMRSHDASFWKEAINDEMESIMGNDTWVLADLPPKCKPIGCKWIFKKKLKVDGTIDKFKARLVAQGFRQKPGIDYFDTYAPVARISTIRLLITLAAINNLVIHQMDVKTAFLNGDLEEEIYMKQPEGFVVEGQEDKVCKLVKSLYGLKQAPKQWHQKFDEVVLSNGFKLNNSDKCVYSKFDDNGQGVIICLYVDDMLIFGTSMSKVDMTKEFLRSKFSMKDLGEADIILGIRVKKEQGKLILSQSHYIEKVLKKFNVSENLTFLYSTPMDPSIKLLPNEGDAISQLEYARAIGCLMYAMTSTRPDIAYAVGQLSRYTSNPSMQHWQAVRRVFKYLKRTMEYGLCYRGYPSVLEGYSDASWISNRDHSSTSGWVFMYGGGPISWSSKKQTCIADSTMTSEFIALHSAGKEAEWLRDLMHEIPLLQKPISPIVIHCDNNATLAKAYSQVYNGKSRHIGVRHSYIQGLIRNSVITIDYVRTKFNLADCFTKALTRDVIHRMAIGLGLEPYLITNEGKPT